MDGSSLARTWTPDGCRADDRLHFAIQLGRFLLEYLQGSFGILPGLMAFIRIEDQKCGQNADTDRRAYLPGKCISATRMGRPRRSAINARAEFHATHVPIEFRLLTFHGIPLSRH